MTRISSGGSPYMLSDFHRRLWYDEQKRKTMTDAPKGSNADEWARGYAQAVEDAAEKIRRLSAKLDICACEDVLQIADELSALTPATPAPVTVQEAAIIVADAIDADMATANRMINAVKGVTIETTMGHWLAQCLRALAEQEGE